MPFDSMPNIDHADTTLGVLLRARLRVASGWKQGSLYGGGSYCVVGGVHEDKNKKQRDDAIAYLYRALPHIPWWRRRRSKWANLTATENYLANYNDTPGRTRAEVVALYDRAIALCRSDN